MAETKNQLEKRCLLDHFRQHPEQGVNSRQADQVVDHGGQSGRFAEQSRHEVPIKQTDETPVERSHDDQDSSNPINNLHAKPPNKLIITVLLYQTIDGLSEK